VPEPHHPGLIDRVIAFSAQHRWWVVAGAVLLAFFGIRAALRTPIDAIPDLSENQVIVFTEWPGHGPKEIEDQVSYPLSLELRGIDGVRVVRSSSDVGFAMLSVVFEDRVGWEEARGKVSEALSRSQSRWPVGAAPRLAPDAAATGQIFWYTVEGAGQDPGRLRAIQDWTVRPQLAGVPGVAEVASVGGMLLEYRVELDPGRLRAFGISAAQVGDAVQRANSAVGGDVVHKANAEFVSRGVGWLGARPGRTDASFEPQLVIRDLENTVVIAADGRAVPLADLGHVVLGAAPRRGILDKDGTEVAGGVVLMRRGENPLDVTRRLRQRIQEIQTGLPPGVNIVTVYDRTPLIRTVVGTVTDTLLEAILVSAVCILVVLRHIRTSFIIALTLPLSVLFSFGLVDLLRRSGWLAVETNLMSLAGLAISIGVLVDCSIVMSENVMHRLKSRFGSAPVTGDTRADVLAACREVGRPIFFTVLIMLLSFLPVFALGGLEGKMFHPLAWTKSFAMLGVGLLAITLVPALCTVFVRGRLRSEEEVRLVRGLTNVYRPVLAWLIDRPAAIVWFLGVIFVLAAGTLGVAGLLPAVVAIAAAACLWMAKRPASAVAAVLTLVLVGLAAGTWVQPLKREFLVPLDEGMAMDMPITVPRMSSTQAADDLRTRDMVFCRFPEVEMVVGKAGRAETATDPAPLDMIETMIGFRPHEFWPRRCLRAGDSEEHAAVVLDALIRGGVVRDPGSPAARREFAERAAMEAVARFDAQMREAAHQRNKEFERGLGPRLSRFLVERQIEDLRDRGLLGAGAEPALADSALGVHASHLAMQPTPEAVAALTRETLRRLAAAGALASIPDPQQDRRGLLDRGKALAWELLGGSEPTTTDRLFEAVRSRHRIEWREHTARLNAELLERAAGLYTRLALEAVLQSAEVISPDVVAAMQDWHKFRHQVPVAADGAHHHGREPLPFLNPLPEIDALQSELTEQFSRRLVLRARDRVELAGFGGELDRAMQMPGWTNIWTMPIQNRVDMLATGVNTSIGVRVLGARTEDVVKASEEIAALLKTRPGAVDVVADPVRGKGSVEVVPDRARESLAGVSPGAVTDLFEFAVGGRVVTTIEGRERRPVRVCYSRDFRQDEESIRGLPLLVRSNGGVKHLPLSAVADIRVSEGPASIKGENGRARNYVRLNVRGVDAEEFVNAARQAVATHVKLPEGVVVEWTGQFEHHVRARRTLQVAIPVVVALIFLLLWWTFGDLADGLLMLLAVPGSLAGGLIVVWLAGQSLSVASWVGFIAGFGMATSTGVVMLVYLRQAVARGSGISTPEELKTAVLDGATKRLRPKLLTEATTLLGLAPLLLSSGVGSEMLRPMVLPVIGGLLLADEVIDLFLPVMFHRIRLRRLIQQSGAHGSRT
jgi:Cu(I)/Ag(I) efflux system membrane protein CusA/SilA